MRQQWQDVEPEPQPAHDGTMPATGISQFVQQSTLRGTTVTDDDFVATVRAIFDAFNERRFGDFASYMAEDLVETFPQSGEHIEGRRRQQASHEALPVAPTFAVRNVLRSGDLAVVEVDESYPDGTLWKDAFILQLRDGAVAAMTVYFGSPFAPPEWRRPFVER